VIVGEVALTEGGEDEGTQSTGDGVALTEGGEDEEARLTGHVTRPHLLAFVVVTVVVGVVAEVATVVVEGLTEVEGGEVRPENKAGQYHVLEQCHVQPLKL